MRGNYLKRSTFFAWWKSFSGISHRHPVLAWAKLSSVTALSTCSRSSENRTIPMRDIAEQTMLSVEDVEYLLMKSLSVRPTLQKPCLALFGSIIMVFWHYCAFFFFRLVL
jgi:hypothetical protein